MAIEFDGASWSTRPLVYRYRLKDRDTDWRTTRDRRAEYENLQPGVYTFELQAVDQNLTYSSIASVAFTLRDPQQERIEELKTRVRERTRELEEKNRALEEANRFKSEFLARMSHDLRTPMNAIIGYTRILLRRAQDALDERQYRNLENIQTSAGNLLILINDILDLSKIELSVADTGPGIPPEDLPHIFEEFHQVDSEGGQEGTGLGLSIAKKSVELLGGTISAESRVGEGTNFTLRIRDYQPEAG